VWTPARGFGHGIAQLTEWLCAAPARLSGVFPQKGAIVRGAAADLVVWDPDAAFEVRAESIHHRHPLTPYLGRTLHGVVHATFLAGEKIFDKGRFTATPRGRLITAAGAGPRDLSPRLF
jgi:allantoinase